MRIIILALLAGLLCACQSLEIDMPAPIVEPPEVPGKYRMTGDIVGGPSQTVTIVENAGDRPPDLTQPRADNAGIVGAAGEYGFAEGWGAALSMNTTFLSNTYFYFKLKYQLAGSPAAKPQPGFHLAWWGRAGYGISTASGDQDEALGSGGYPWAATAKDSVWGVGASLGYRFNKYFMLYTGAARDWHHIKADIDQDPAKGTAGGSYETFYDGRYSAATLGALYSAKRARFGVSMVYTDFEFPEINRNFDLYYGLQLGVVFGGDKKKKSKKRRKKHMPKYIEVEEGEECEDDDDYVCVDE